MVYRVICMIKIFPYIIQCLPIETAGYHEQEVVVVSAQGSPQGCVAAKLTLVPRPQPQPTRLRR